MPKIANHAEYARSVCTVQINGASDLQQHAALKELKPALVYEWLDALLSGEYKQTSDVLVDFFYNTSSLSLTEGEKRHCCLGVACEVLPHMEYDENNPSYLSEIQERATTELFYEDQEILGLCHDIYGAQKLYSKLGLEGPKHVKDAHGICVHLNDKEHSFEEIATFLAHYYDLLFEEAGFSFHWDRYTK